MPPCPLVIAPVPLKCTVEIYNIVILLGCPLPRRRAWCPCPIKNEAHMPEMPNTGCHCQRLLPLQKYYIQKDIGYYECIIAEHNQEVKSGLFHFTPRRSRVKCKSQISPRAYSVVIFWNSFCKVLIFYQKGVESLQLMQIESLTVFGENPKILCAIIL